MTRSAAWSRTTSPARPASCARASAWPRTSPDPSHERALGRGLQVIAPVAAPFVATAGEIGARAVENNPSLRDEYRKRLEQFDDYDRERPSTRHAIASELLQETHDRARAIVQDPEASLEERAAASVIEGLIKAQKFAEFGGPQGARAVAQLARYGAGALGRTIERGEAERVAQRPRIRTDLLEQAEVEYPAGLSPELLAEARRVGATRIIEPGKHRLLRTGEGELATGPAAAAARRAPAPPVRPTGPVPIGAMTRSTAATVGRSPARLDFLERRGVPAVSGGAFDDIPPAFIPPQPDRSDRPRLCGEGARHHTAKARLVSPGHRTRRATNARIRGQGRRPHRRRPPERAEFAAPARDRQDRGA